MKKIISYILLTTTMIAFMPFATLAQTANVGVTITGGTVIDVVATISTNIIINLTTGEVTPADMELKNNSNVPVDVKITNIAPTTETIGPNTFVGANDKDWENLNREDTLKYANFNIKKKGSSETPKDILANTDLELGALDKKGNTDSTKVYEVSAHMGSNWDSSDKLFMYQITLVFSQAEDYTVGFGEYVCVPASGDDLKYAYESEFYDQATGQNMTGVLAGTNTTGNKEIGDAYRCTVGDGISYVFNILEIKDDNVSLMMNQNIDNLVVGWCEFPESQCKIGDEWTNQNGPISANWVLETRTSAWTNPKIMSIQLPSAQTIATIAGYDEPIYGEDLPTWLYGNLKNSLYYQWATGYWTSTVGDGSDSVWVVQTYGFLNTSSVNVNTTYGIRPVITISIDDIQ